ncbi:MAG: GNAT family N-acetyltransferase [Actinomycetota bacterium]
MTVVVRPAEPSDGRAVLELAHRLEIGVAPWRDPAAVAAAVRGWVEESLIDGRTTAFVAEDGGEVVGFVSVSPTEHFAGERDADVGELIVAEDAERRGVGRALLERAESWAADAGFRCITLTTGAANTVARSFYAASGYAEEDVKLTKLLRDG